MLEDPASMPDEATLEILLDQGFLLKENVDENVVFESWKQQMVHDFSAVHSKILVTRRCNNRCVYCIVDPEAKDMTLETARAMDRFYLNFIKDKNPKKVDDDDSGGAVLLNPEVVLESATRRYHFCLGKGIDYGFTILSNGTLVSRQVVSALKEVGLRFLRISMAGPAEVHDKLRPSAQGGKTYETIMKNLQSVADLTQVNIEYQYDSSTEDYLRVPEMLDDFTARGITVKNISFSPILPRRGETKFLSGSGSPEAYLYLAREAQRRGFPHLSEAPSNSCAADFRAKFAFDTDGTLIPCPSLQSGEFVCGNVYKGRDFASMAMILNRKLSDRCWTECEILPVCMGGCRLQALTRTGCFDGVDCRYDMLSMTVKEYVKQKTMASVGPGAV
jgi:uncharacterized protein